MILKMGGITPINLSIAENFVIRDELVEICKDVLKEKLVPDVKVWILNSVVQHLIDY